MTGPKCCLIKCPSASEHTSTPHPIRTSYKRSILGASCGRSLALIFRRRSTRPAVQCQAIKRHSRATCNTPCIKSHLRTDPRPAEAAYNNTGVRAGADPGTGFEAGASHRARTEEKDSISQVQIEPSISARSMAIRCEGAGNL